MIYEWVVARRYLMPEGRVTFVFVMTVLSIIGVAMGVASLIVVLSVMNGFGDDLRSKILEGRSHLIFMGVSRGEVFPLVTGLPEAFMADPNVEAAAPVIESLGLAVADLNQEEPEMVNIRGIDPFYQEKINNLDKHLIAGSLERLKPGAESAPQPQEATAEATVSIDSLFERPHPLPGIAIGRELATTMFGVFALPNADKEVEREVFSRVLGERLTLITAPRGMGLKSLVPQRQPFEVVGVFGTGHYEFDLLWVYISIPSGQYLRQTPGMISQIDMKLKNYGVNQTNETAKRIIERTSGLLLDTRNNAIIDSRHPQYAELIHQLQSANEETTSVDRGASLEGIVELRGWAVTWMKFNEIFFRALVIEKKMMGYILAIIVLVATFSILTTLFMIVMIKTRDIGVLRAIGVSRGGILRIFISVGLLIGIIGTLLGAGIGLGVCEYISRTEIPLPGSGQIYTLQFLPVAVRSLDVINVMIYTICISFLSTILPALRAAKLDPTQCLRST